jgi:hypothetical protein
MDKINEEQICFSFLYASSVMEAMHKKLQNNMQHIGGL